MEGKGQIWKAAAGGETLAIQKIVKPQYLAALHKHLSYRKDNECIVPIRLSSRIIWGFLYDLNIMWMAFA